MLPGNIATAWPVTGRADARRAVRRTHVLTRGQPHDPDSSGRGYARRGFHVIADRERHPLPVRKPSRIR